jgi:hypothetical protein
MLMRLLAILFTLVAVASSARAETVVAVAPFSSMSQESTASDTRKLAASIEAALATAKDTRVISASATLDAIKKAKRPHLRGCEGEMACLVELGTLMAANHLVVGEIGGLGDAQVVYLQLIDVAAGAELRSTTLALGGQDALGGAAGAVVRLTNPEQFVGSLDVVVDTPGASVFVNGKKMGSSPVKAFPVAVGTHALRVTHPEFRDFVRFVDVPFAETVAVPVNLQQFPMIQTTLNEKERDRTTTRMVEERWYRKWWAVAALGVVLAGSAIAIGAATADGIDPDYTRPVGN